MNILTVENKTFSLDNVPDSDVDLRYCILDAGDPTYLDFYFPQLIFLESFYSPAMVLKIGDQTVQMPIDWSIAICDDDMYNEIEMLPLTSLNNRGFHTPVFNPLENRAPSVKQIDVVNIYQDVKWFFPKLKHGHMVVVPLGNGPKPRCALFCKDINKINDVLDISDIF